MSWIFPAFFGVLALALLVYIMMSVRERMYPREQVVCVLESRQREKFPKLTLFYSFAFDGQTVTRKCKEPKRK